MNNPTEEQLALQIELAKLLKYKLKVGDKVLADKIYQVVQCFGRCDLGSGTGTITEIGTGKYDEYKIKLNHSHAKTSDCHELFTTDELMDGLKENIAMLSYFKSLDGEDKKKTWSIVTHTSLNDGNIECKTFKDTDLKIALLKAYISVLKMGMKSIKE